VQLPDGRLLAARSARREDAPGYQPTMLPERPAAVLAVVYLIFNEGYGGRGELAAEALRLGTALVELMPDEAEVHGLHALMLLNDARREARFEGGELVLLGDQNRSRWDVARTARGREALDRAFALPGGGPYNHPGRDRVNAHGGAARLAADRRAVRGARPAARLSCC
jgi:predicted RNA polymerase sigma factor